MMLAMASDPCDKIQKEVTDVAARKGLNVARSGITCLIGYGGAPVPG